jgi:hypothetical protein
MAGVAAAAVVGCSTSNPETPTPSPSDTVSATPTPTPSPSETVDTTPRWPLTGVPFEEGDAEKAAHIPVAVKVPVEKRSFPQLGVEAADLVFVQAQGKSYDTTRLCAIFHSEWPKDGANPVRSTRPVDVPLLVPLKAVVLACTGAIPWVLKYVRKRKQNIELREKYGDSSDRWRMWKPGGWLKGSNAVDKTVVAMPKNLARDSKLDKGEIPPTYLVYNPPGVEPSSVNGTPVEKATIFYKGSNVGTEYHRWEWDAEAGLFAASIRFYEGKTWYKWITRSKKQIKVPNVIIMFCEWHMGRIKGYTGHSEPIYSITGGTDKFIYFNNGKYVTGTWKKGDYDALPIFTLDDGTPLYLEPGKTWIEMPQTGARVDLV